MRAFLYALLMLVIPLLAFAEDGYVYGNNHCFYFSAPTGWTADHLSGKDQGLAFVFYPASSSWSNATTVIYAAVTDKSKSLKEPKDKARETLEQFHKDYDSPNSKAEKLGVIKSRSGTVGEIYKYTGDKWGNTELVAYFNGRNTINSFVMTSRDAKDLERNRKALEELAQSYREANDCKPCGEPGNTSSCRDNAEIIKKLPATLNEAKALGDQ